MERRRDDVVLCRARIGHAYFTNGYLLRGELRPMCCNTRLTVRHVLLSCAKYAHIRRKYFAFNSPFELFRGTPAGFIIHFLRECNVTNQHFYIEPVSIRCIVAHASRSFSFSDHKHLSLHYDESIGNGIIFIIDVTWTYYMTEFCVFDSFSVIVWKMLMKQDDLFQDFTPTSPPCLARFLLYSLII